mgnify:CR=1 FL=1
MQTTASSTDLRPLGQTDIRVSAIGLGVMEFSGGGGLLGRAFPVISQETKNAIVQAALDGGINWFDTAEMYGPYTNEELLGQTLAEAGRRDEAVIATKFGTIRHTEGDAPGLDGSPANVRLAVEGSLRRLRTDRIDLYYQHRMDPAVPIEETVGALAELVTEGKVRHIGLSEASADTIRRAHAVHPIAAVQTEYSLFSRDVEAEVLPTLRELGIGLVAYSPLGRGFLSGRFSSPEDLDEGDFRRALTLFRETHFGPIPVAEERRAQFEARLRNLLAQKLKQHLGDNMAANALLLLSAARTVFPELWADSERKARFHFLARSPVIAVAGEGAEEITVWLREARLPLGDGQAVLKVDATRPELLLTESPPSVGIEEKLVPAELERRPHPARGAILAEIALAGMAPPEPGDPWERDFLRRRSAFFHERRRELARQLEALPEHAYHFGWQKARVSVVHHQVKAELRVALALGPAFGNADGPPETLAVSRSYTAQAPPGVDPYSRGYFPSKNAMRAELGALLGRKARELVLARFDAALKDMVKTAVRQAGEGDGEGAVELLAHVYAARGEGLTAGKEAEALLARAWGRANVEFLLAAPAGAFAEKPVK